MKILSALHMHDPDRARDAMTFLEHTWEIVFTSTKGE